VQISIKSATGEIGKSVSGGIEPQLLSDFEMMGSDGNVGFGICQAQRQQNHR